MKRFLRTFSLAAAIAGLACQPAAAATITLEAVWVGYESRGEPHGGSGRFTLDDSLLSEYKVFTSNPLFYSMEMSLTSPYRNGTYDKSDYEVIYFRGLAGLDYSRELIGQMMPDGCAFGNSQNWTPCFGSSAFTMMPVYTPYFNAPTGGLVLHGLGQMFMTSLRVVDVPEPSSLPLLALAAGALIVTRRRKA